ncbi:hypothetical protein ABH930_006840, partial [Kitasatospora sp. GAS204A]|nr:hypothetical protein [Kitasatospora sp. GAS204B]
SSTSSGGNARVSTPNAIRSENRSTPDDFN